ncbi:hypothetical protein Bca52824_076095 [Brassica carinata]|uniref:Uncharacterized protein n=1 Tax=Brassica carinata TaxID=52824 RepID=A0A8X7TX62_BRACI|nr:hypothetical protein Bca52824_076095 [Brassica carinata]
MGLLRRFEAMSPPFRVCSPSPLLSSFLGLRSPSSHSGPVLQALDCSLALGFWVQHCPASVTALARSVESDPMLLILGEFLNPSYLLGDEACFLFESWSSYPFYPSRL